MSDKSHPLSVTRQVELLNLSRWNVYCLPKAVLPADPALMRRMDALHLEYPFVGPRKVRDMLGLESIEVGRSMLAR